MKIPFTLDAWLKDTSQRVETKSGKPARIICTDFSHKGYPVVAAINYDGHEEIELYNITGGYGAPREHNFMDLVFVTPEPELSEFELRLLDWLSSDTYGEISMDEMKKCVKNRATELLELARKELRDEIEFRGEEYRKGYEDGKAEALKDLPRWRKCGEETLRTYGDEHFEYRGGECYLVIKGREILLSNLEKLPGFKED